MKLDRLGVERCVPHAGAMVLLDSVVRWDAESIDCTALAPTFGHPLMHEGRVSAVAAAEYAAQAAAVHGTLLEGASAARAGVLAKLSDCELLADAIPTSRGPLDIKAELLSRTDAGCAYAFVVSCGEPIVRGRLMVVFVSVTAI